MKFFDIEEKIVGKPKIFDDLMFFLMKDIQAETGKKILGFFRLGDKKRIKIFLLEKLFNLFASSLIIKKRMLRRYFLIYDILNTITLSNSVLSAVYLVSSSPSKAFSGSLGYSGFKEVTIGKFSFSSR